MTPLPFRWKLAGRPALGTLLDGDREHAYRGFFIDLRDCGVRVVAAAADGDLVFVGRSPESIFDYLTGVLSGTSWSERLVLLNLSMRHSDVEQLARTDPGAIAAIRDQLASLGLSPGQIAASERPKVFVDLVYGGNTFGHFLGLLEHWAADARVDVAAVRRRIRFLGITSRSKNSPNTWRWYQQVEWARRVPRAALRSVSISYGLWVYLGEYQRKVARWHPPARWGAEDAARPPRDEDALKALRLAHMIHERGRGRVERDRFAAELAAQPQLRDPSVRRLILELRGTSARHER
ncbi:MAG TPA: hypothetical protein VGB92_08285 [Longimicrobium sp.]